MKKHYCLAALAALASIVPATAESSDEIAVPAKETVSLVPAKVVPGRKPLLFVGVALQEHNHLGLEYGLTIVFVQKDSPAEKAGIAAGDVLLTFDGQKIFNSNQFFKLLSTYEPGAAVPAEILRGGNVFATQIQPEIRQGRMIENAATAAKKEAPRGIHQRPARDDVRIIINGREYSLSDNAREWRDRVAVTKDALIIRTNEIRDEISAFADKIRSRMSQTPRPDERFSTFEFKMNGETDGVKTESHAAFLRHYFGDGYDVVYSGRDKERTLTVKKADGTTLFDGPCATPEEIEAVPAEVRAVVEKFMPLKSEVNDRQNDGK